MNEPYTTLGPQTAPGLTMQKSHEAFFQQPSPTLIAPPKSRGSVCSTQACKREGKNGRTETHNG